MDNKFINALTAYDLSVYNLNTTLHRMYIILEADVEVYTVYYWKGIDQIQMLREVLDLLEISLRTQIAKQE